MIERDGLLQGRAQGGRIPLPLGGLGLGERRLKVGHIAADRRITSPVQGWAFGAYECVGHGDRLPHGMQQLAQVGARLGLAGVGPEQEGEVLAGLRGGAVQQEVGQ